MEIEGCAWGTEANYCTLLCTVEDSVERVHCAPIKTIKNTIFVIWYINLFKQQRPPDHHKENCLQKINSSQRIHPASHTYHLPSQHTAFLSNPFVIFLPFIQPTAQQSTMAFAQSLLRKMLSDNVTDKHYDVFFIVQTRLRDGTLSEIRLGAHRVVLSAVSDKFEESFESIEASPSPTQPGKHINEIVIQDCSAAAVREALEIMYGGELREAKKRVLLALEIWHFGVLFAVDYLIQLARSSCLNNLSTDNCLRILDFAVHVEDVQIVDKLQNYASENANFSHVITSPDFERLDFKVVSSLVRPGKGECAWPEILTFEKVWFDALVKWLAPRVMMDDKAKASTAQPADAGSSVGNTSAKKLSPESIVCIEKVLALVDFTRMKTHELRDVSKNEIAVNSTTFAPELVNVLLTRSEQLESTILERNIDLDVIGQKYQQALCEQDEAERKARAAIEGMDKMQSSKLAIEKRYEELRRRRPPTSSGPSVNSARRKVSGTSTII